MKKTIKIIDLLNKIANGEEVPNFWWSGCIHKVEKDINGKYNIFDTYCKKYKNIYLEDLNDEVEIIEEDKKIEKLNIQSVKDNPTNMYIVNEYGTKCYMTKHSREIALKLNELIDVVNELKGKSE